MQPTAPIVYTAPAAAATPYTPAASSAPQAPAVHYAPGPAASAGPLLPPGPGIPGGPAQPLSPFGLLAEKFLEAYLREPSGAIADVKLQEFFEAAEIYRAVIAPMGTAVNLVLQDFDKNLQVCRAALAEDPRGRATLRSFLQSEVDRGFHRQGPGETCGLKDPSGACQMQWLLRGLQFFLSYVQYLFQGNGSGAANKAYSETLQPYHKWMTSMGVKAAMMAMPGQESVKGIQALCPAEPDRSKAKEIVARDGTRAAEAALPLIAKMISIHRELGLWQDQQV